MSLKLAARLVTFEPYKIADLQENDTTAHLLDISSIVGEGCIAVLVRATRAGGTGAWKLFPISGAAEITTSSTGINIHPIRNREIKWRNTVANDDWDVYLYGYFVQKQTR